MSLTTPNSANQPGRFVMLRHDLLNSPAWQSLPLNARALYVEIAKRFNGQNNGHIVYSLRDATRELHIGQNMAFRLLRLLEWRGLIRCTSRGSFSRKDAKASEWELTDYRTVLLQNPYGSTTEPVNGSNGSTTVPLIDKDIDSRCRRPSDEGRKEGKQATQAIKKIERLTPEQLASLERLAKMNGDGR